MKIRFVGARPREVVSAGRSFTVQPVGEYEVPDRLGSAMCEQKWFEPVDEQAATESATEEPQKPARASRKEQTP
jgi:hypothetical protein